MLTSDSQAHRNTHTHAHHTHSVVFEWKKELSSWLSFSTVVHVCFSKACLELLGNLVPLDLRSSLPGLSQPHDFQATEPPPAAPHLLLLPTGHTEDC